MKLSHSGTPIFSAVATGAVVGAGVELAVVGAASRFVVTVGVEHATSTKALTTHNAKRIRSFIGSPRYSGESRLNRLNWD